MRAVTGRHSPEPRPTAPVTAARRDAADRPLAIVLIDDNPDIRETMFDLLTTWGHNVETAADGPSGVELILRTRPDLAFVDIGLPRLDGYGVAAQVREQLGFDRTRLVAMSGFGQEADRRRSLEVGFNAHLVKPADIDAILERAVPLARTGDVDADTHRAQRKQEARRKDQRSSAHHRARPPRSCWRALRAFARGEFDTRLPDELDGVDGQICEAFNDLAQFAEALRAEVAELRQLVGREGRTHRRLGRSPRPRRLGATTSTGSTRCWTI